MKRFSFKRKSLQQRPAWLNVLGSDRPIFLSKQPLKKNTFHYIGSNRKSVS